MSKIFYWILPFYLISFVTTTAGTEIFGWSLFAFFVFNFLSDSKKNGLKNNLKQLVTPIDIALLFFGAWALLGSYVVTKDLTEVAATFRNIRWILLFYAFVYLLRKYFFTNYQKHFKALVIAVIIAGLYGILQMFTGLDFVRGAETHIVAIGGFYRASGFHSISLTYSYCLGMAGLFIFTALLMRKELSTSSANIILQALACFAMVGGIVASSTRGAWIALFISVIVSALLYDRKKAALGLVASIFIASSLMLVPTIQDRAVSILDVSEQGGNSKRIAIWKANWTMFKENPVWGVGLEKNKSLLNIYLEKMSLQDQIDAHTYHAHNDVLQTLSGTGLPGLLAWLILGFYFLKLSYDLYKQSSNSQIKALALGAFASQAYMYIGGITQVNFYDNEVTHILMFTWALLLAIKKWNLTVK